MFTQRCSSNSQSRRLTLQSCLSLQIIFLSISCNQKSDTIPVHELLFHNAADCLNPSKAKRIIMKRSFKVLFFDAAVKHHFAGLNNICEAMKCAFSLELHHISRLSSVDMILRNIFVGIVSQDCIFGSWFKLRSSHSILELLGRFTQRNVWLAILFEIYSHRQKLLLNIDYSLHSDSVVEITRDSKIEMFSVAVHGSCIPHFAERCPSIVFIKQVSIDENIIITIGIHILGLNSECKIDVVIFIAISLWFKACNDHWIPLFNIGLDPLQEIFVLRL